MPIPHRNSASESAPRTCPVCGADFRPYRDFQRTCNRKCYRKLPDVKASNNAIKARPESRERANAARRIGGRLYEASAKRNRRVQLLRRYGITPEQYSEMFVAQGGCCAICRNPQIPGTGPATKQLHVDHDHETGKVRGLLCNQCNPGLGYFQDDISRLLAAAKYLENTK